jgi:hypothetical protein
MRKRKASTQSRLLRKDIQLVEQGFDYRVLPLNGVGNNAGALSPAVQTSGANEWVHYRRWVMAAFVRNYYLRPSTSSLTTWIHYERTTIRSFS